MIVDFENVVSPERLRLAKVLVVDDMAVSRESLRLILEDDHVVMLASSGEEALEVIAREKPDIVLLDVVLGGISGIEVCERLKADEVLSKIPVLIITSDDSEDAEQNCWEAGAADFIMKPASAVTVLKRIKAQLTISWQSEYLHALAYHDGLSQLYNRRYFDLQFEPMVGHYQRYGGQLSLMLIDIDHFKAYNDKYGHQKGDDCIKFVASVIRSKLMRPMDMVCRYGGEEFVVLLPETDQPGAEQVAEAINAALSIKEIPCLQELNDDALVQVTVSIGVATLASGDSAEVLIQRADRALYRAKRDGRNCYRVDEALAC